MPGKKAGRLPFPKKILALLFIASGKGLLPFGPPNPLFGEKAPRFVRRRRIGARRRRFIICALCCTLHTNRGFSAPTDKLAINWDPEAFLWIKKTNISCIRERGLFYLENPLTLVVTLDSTSANS